MCKNKKIVTPIIFSDEKNSSLSDAVKFGAFASVNKKNIESEIPIPNVPFSKLLLDQQSPEIKSSQESDCSKTILIEDNNGNSPVDSPTGLTMKSTNDDFIMVDLVNFSANVPHAYSL